MSADERTLGERVTECFSTLERPRLWLAAIPTAAALLREQADECLRLQAEIASLEEAAGHAEVRFEQMLGEIDSLRRDLEAARDYIEALDVQNHRLRCDADTDRLNAERYRWLRGDLCEDHSHRWTQWEVRCWKAPMWTDDLRREDLDAAIDLARARGEGNADD